MTAFSIIMWGIGLSQGVTLYRKINSKNTNIRSFKKIPGNRWCHVQNNSLLWIKKRTLTTFVALGRGHIGARNDTTQQSGQTPDKQVDISHCLCELLCWNRSCWNVVSQQRPTVWPNKNVVSQQRPTVWPNKVGLFRADSLAKHLLQFA